jgi:GAF domain-containing protein
LNADLNLSTLIFQRRGMFASMNRIPSALAARSAATVADSRRAIERTARAAVPSLADFCLVHLVAGRGITFIAGAHATRAGRRHIRALMRTHRIRPDDPDSTVAQVVRTRRPTLRTTIFPDLNERNVRTGGIADLHRRLAPTSALVVPILRDGTVLGAVSLCYSQSGRSYGARHLPSAERLASRIAEVLTPGARTKASLGLRAAARHARQSTTMRRRVAARN